MFKQNKNKDKSYKKKKKRRPIKSALFYSFCIILIVK